MILHILLGNSVSLLMQKKTYRAMFCILLESQKEAIEYSLPCCATTYVAVQLECV